ncbi:MAG: hypothetical protein KDB23_13895 [Planctomycetales bacterium]|nr:hypothetical protein [Planctomycetales bacterium]
MIYFLRWIRPLAILVAICGMAIYTGVRWKGWVEQRQRQRDIQDAVRSTAFLLTSDRWLEFDIQSSAVALRVLTNAAVSHTDTPEVDLQRPRVGWRYRVDYELYDSRGKQLQTQAYHLRTQINDVRDPVSGDNGLTWFDSSVAIPAQTRTIQIPLDRLPARAARLRIKLGDMDADINEVVIRAYMKYERQDYDQPYAWSRLSVDRRQKLCRANVYPPELLSPIERRNLLRWNWAAIAPLGKHGRDYTSLRIYQREAPQTRQLTLLPPEESVICEPEQPLTFALPPTPGDVKLDFYPELEDGQTNETHVLVNVHRQPLGIVESRTVTITDLAEVLSLNVAGGEILEVRADGYVTCHATWLVPEPLLQEVSIERAGEPSSPAARPEAISLSTTMDSLQSHLIDKAGSLSYRIAHVGEQVTPFRITVRQLWPVEEQMPAKDERSKPSVTPVRFEWLDQAGEVLRAGELPLESTVSDYDHGAIGAARLQVSEPATYYFALTPDVSQVRLYLDEGLACAVAFTRPLDLPRTFQIPEESNAYTRQEHSQRSWFLIRPEQAERRIELNEIANLSIQVRPPVPNPDRAEGDYTWKKFDPTAFSVGRYFVTRYDPGSTVRPEVAAIVYSQVFAGQEQTVQRMLDVQGEAAELRLLYAWDDDHAVRDLSPVRLYVDNVLWHAFVPRARTGEIILPELPAGTNQCQLRLETRRRGRCFVRGLSTGETGYMKRFAHQISSEPLEFELIKETDQAETFILRAFFVLDAGEIDRVARASAGTGDESVVMTDRFTTYPVGLFKPAQGISMIARRQVQLDLLDVERRQTGSFSGWTLSHRVYDIAPDASEPAIAIDGRPLFVDQGERCAFVLGEDLPAGLYHARISLLDDGQPRDASTEQAFVSVYHVTYGDRSLRAIDSRPWLVPGGR